MKKWSDLKKDLLKDKKVAKEYKKLEPYYNLVDKLIEARVKQGFTQSQLAEKIGTKQSAIARIESGNANPSFVTLQKIAQALNSKLEIKFTPQT